MKKNYIVIAVVLVIIVAGGGLFLTSRNKTTKNEVPTSTTKSPSASSKPNPNAGQVTISGAVNNTFTPAKVEANILLRRNIIIYLSEKKMSPNGISISFPVDTQPGTYTMVYYMEADAVSGMYQVSSGGDAIVYDSTKGTLTLTAVGSKFSGQFQFTAVNRKDASKTIEVSGSFTDVPVNK